MSTFQSLPKLIELRMIEMSKCAFFLLCQRVKLRTFIMRLIAKQCISFKMSTEILSNTVLYRDNLKMPIIKKNDLGRFHRGCDLVINNHVKISQNECEKITNFCEESNQHFKCFRFF